MKMRKSWLCSGLAAVLLVACGGDSSSSNTSAADVSDAGAADDEEVNEPGPVDDAESDDVASDDSSSSADDSDADDSDADDSDADDGSQEPDPEAAPADGPDASADAPVEEDLTEAGSTVVPDAPGDEGGSSAESPADAGVDEIPAMPDSVVVDGADGGLGIEITFSGEGVECGEARCRDATIDEFGIGASGCCSNESESICGLNMSTLGLALGLSNPGCEQLDAPGSAAPECPESAPVQVLIPGAPSDGLVMPGCCQPSGVCGFSADFGNFGFGCVDPTRFRQESAGDCEYQP